MWPSVSPKSLYKCQSRASIVPLEDFGGVQVWHETISPEDRETGGQDTQASKLVPNFPGPAEVDIRQQLEEDMAIEGIRRRKTVGTAREKLYRLTKNSRGHVVLEAFGSLRKRKTNYKRSRRSRTD